MFLGGKVRAAVRMVTNRDVGGAYRPFNTDSKFGRPVIDLLREKHPTPGYLRSWTSMTTPEPLTAWSRCQSTATRSVLPRRQFANLAVLGRAALRLTCSRTGCSAMEPSPSVSEM